MIQINLVPDIKQEYLRARKMRRTAISLAIVAGLSAIGIVVLLGLLLGGQMVHDTVVQSQIKDEQRKLSSYQDVQNIVTIQNQLSKISGINDQRTMGTRLFGVLEAINPKGEDAVKFTNVRLDTKGATIYLEGIAPKGYNSVEALKKTISKTKFEYLSNGTQRSEDLSTGIKMTGSNYGEDGNGSRIVRFMMSVSYNSSLFKTGVTDARIATPNGQVNVTDSRLGVPDSLFSAPVKDDKNGGKNG